MVNMSSHGVSGETPSLVTEKHDESLIDSNREDYKCYGGISDDTTQKNMIFENKNLFVWLFSKAKNGEECFSIGYFLLQDNQKLN